MGNISQADAHKELRFVSSPLTVVNRFTARKPESAYLSSAFKFSCVPSRPSRDEGHKPERKHSSMNLNLLRNRPLFFYTYFYVFIHFRLYQVGVMIQYARFNQVNVPNFAMIAPPNHLKIQSTSP